MHCNCDMFFFISIFNSWKLHVTLRQKFNLNLKGFGNIQISRFCTRLLDYFQNAWNTWTNCFLFSKHQEGGWPKIPLPTQSRDQAVCRWWSNPPPPPFKILATGLGYDFVHFLQIIMWKHKQLSLYLKKIVHIKSIHSPRESKVHTSMRLSWPPVTNRPDSGRNVLVIKVFKQLHCK